MIYFDMFKYIKQTRYIEIKYDIVLRQPCPFPPFRPDPPLWELSQGGGQLFFTFNHVTSNIIIKMKPEQLEKVSSSKKNLCLIVKNFFQDLLFFSWYHSGDF